MKVAKVVVLTIIAISGLIAALAATVQVTLAQGGPGERFTICHAAGLAGTTHFVTLELPREAVFANANGIGGHFFENGTAQAGHEQDYFGPCTTDTTGTTDTTPTTGTTTPTTTGEERGVATAGAICVASENRYRVFGEIDGVLATVSPEFIPGDKSGPTLVNVTVGSDSQLIIVNTSGTCTSTTTTTTTTGTTTTTPPGDTPPGTTTTTTTTTPPTSTTTTTGGVTPTTTTPPTTTVVTPPTTTPPTTTPPARTPTVSKPNKPKPIPPEGIPPTNGTCPSNAAIYAGRCYPKKYGGPVLPGQQG